MRILIRLETRIEGQMVSTDSVPCFSELPQRGGKFRAALTTSLAIHLAGAAVAPSLLSFLSRSFEPVVDFRRAEILPKDAVPLYIRFPQNAPALKPKLDPSKRQSEEKDSPLSAKKNRPKKPAAPAERPVERPATAMLIQPNLGEPRLREVPDLRSIKVWTGLSQRLGPAPIAPGNPEPVPSSLITAIRIRPNIPIPEPVRSDIPTPKLELPPIPAPRLPYVPSGSPPVNSLILQLEEPPPPPGSSTVGNPAAVIASSSLPASSDMIKVPPGSIVVIGSETGTARRVVPKTPQAPATASQGLKGTSAGLSTSVKDGPDTGKPGAAGDSERGKENLGNGTAGVSGEGSGRTGEPGETIRKIRAPGGEITAHERGDGSVKLNYPKDGNFDVVVLESALPERLTQFNYVLSGKPVHTVYLNVGLDAEWLLQYCMPAGSAAQAQQGMVVSLDAPPPLKAPYIIEAVLPGGKLWRSSDYQVFHGILTLTGKLEQLRIIKAGSAGAALLESLSRWTFRPASSGGIPKLVEVLLVIPPFARN